MSLRSHNYFSFLKFNEVRPRSQRDFYKPYFTFAKESVTPPPQAWQDIVKRKEEVQVNVSVSQQNQENVSAFVPAQVEKEESATKKVPHVEDLVNDYVFEFENLDTLYNDFEVRDEEFEQILKDITLYSE